MGVQSCVNRVKRAGLRTQHCGTPVFRVRVEEIYSPTLTFCGLFVRKSRIHEQSLVVKPRFLSLFTSLRHYCIKRRTKVHK